MSEWEIYTLDIETSFPFSQNYFARCYELIDYWKIINRKNILSDSLLLLLIWWALYPLTCYVHLCACIMFSLIDFFELEIFLSIFTKICTHYDVNALLGSMLINERKRMTGKGRRMKWNTEHSLFSNVWNEENLLTTCIFSFL